MSSIFVPPGTSARNNEVQGQTGSEGYLKGLLPGAASYQGQLQSFQSSQLPNLEQGVQNAYTNTTQGGRNAETDAFGQKQQAMAEQAAGQANSKFAGNSALAQGYKLDAANQANQNTGAYQAQLNSPQGENSAWGNYLGANAAASPNYGGLDSMVGANNGQPAVPVGQGLGGFLGSALGSWANAGYPSLSSIMGNIFGSGSGSGTSGSNANAGTL